MISDFFISFANVISKVARIWVASICDDVILTCEKKPFGSSISFLLNLSYMMRVSLSRILLEFPCIFVYNATCEIVFAPLSSSKRSFSSTDLPVSNTLVAFAAASLPPNSISLPFTF